MEWTFCAETFPQVWDHRVLGIKTQLRTWLWQDLKQLTACSVLHPAPEWGETCKVELRSPHFPTKLDYWKEAVSFCICAVPKSVQILLSSSLSLPYLRTTELRLKEITWSTGITWSKPSAQTRIGCQELWTSPRRETPLMTIMGQNSSNRKMD